MIYIVEDDAAIRELEQYALQSSGYEVQSFETSEPFWQAMRAAEPELVILDVMLPGEDGFSILKKLRNTPALRRLPIIMVTAKSSELDTVRGLDCGADDYITKPFSVRELAARVKSLLRRVAPQQESEPQTLRAGDIMIDITNYEAFKGGEKLSLTLKEFELLKVLVLSRGKVLTRDFLLDRIWGYEYYGETRTVDVHIRRLREKLERSPAAPEHIMTKWGVGYYFKF